MVDGQAVLRLSGDLDMDSAELFAEAARRVHAERIPSLVLDLSALDFVDSSGLSQFVLPSSGSGRSGARLCSRHPPARSGVSHPQIQRTQWPLRIPSSRNRAPPRIFVATTSGFHGASLPRSSPPQVEVVPPLPGVRPGVRHRPPSDRSQILETAGLSAAYAHLRSLGPLVRHRSLTNDVLISTVVGTEAVCRGRLRTMCPPDCYRTDR